MSSKKSYIINILLVLALLASVGTLVWGALLVLNGKDGSWHLKAGAALTLMSSIWLIVANLSKKQEA